MRTYMTAVKSRHTASGALLVNTFCVRSDPGPLDPDSSISEAASSIWAWFEPKYKYCISSSCQIETLTVKELYETPAEVYDFPIAVGGSAVSGTATPRELCRILSLRTGLAGRRYRGRVFIPAPQNAGILLSSNGDLFDTSSSWWTYGNQFADDLLSGDDYTYGPGGLYTAHLSLRVYSRVGGFDTDVTGILKPQDVHYLRSRHSVP